MCEFVYRVVNVLCLHYCRALVVGTAVVVIGAAVVVVCFNIQTRSDVRLPFLTGLILFLYDFLIF